MGFGRTVNEQDRERAMKALQQFLRPEFINRVDEVVYFNQLTEENFQAIARIMLDELPDSLKEKGITFTLRRRPAGLPDGEVLLPDLRRPESAPPHPEGAGGRHRHQDHRQLRASHLPGQGHGGGWCDPAGYPVTEEQEREDHAVS